MILKLIQVASASGEILDTPEKISRMMQPEAKADRECFWVLHLDSANRLIEKELVSMGTVNEALVHPREIFKKAIINGASGIITVHNHPAGQLHPSRNDITVWKMIDKAGKLLDIDVLDHFIITPFKTFYSRADNQNQRR